MIQVAMWPSRVWFLILHILCKVLLLLCYLVRYFSFFGLVFFCCIFSFSVQQTGRLSKENQEISNFLLFNYFILCLYFVSCACILFLKIIYFSQLWSITLKILMQSIDIYVVQQQSQTPNHLFILLIKFLKINRFFKLEAITTTIPNFSHCFL